MSGDDPGLLHGEHRAGAAEAGENLVEDQQQVVAGGRVAQALQHGGRVEHHAARALHQRLDDDAGDLARVAIAGIRSSRCGARFVARQIER